MRLNHSNIVQMLDLGQADGRYFLVLEFVDGWTWTACSGGRRRPGFPSRRRWRSTSSPRCAGPGLRPRARRAATANRWASSTATSARTTSCSATGRGQAGRLRHRQGAAHASEKSAGNVIKGRSPTCPRSRRRASAGRALRPVLGRDVLYVMLTGAPVRRAHRLETLLLVRTANSAATDAMPGLNPESIASSGRWRSRRESATSAPKRC